MNMYNMHNITRFHRLPFRHAVMTQGHRHSIGRGNGSILLQKGGAGSASSYLDIDDYIHQTGRNPYKDAKSHVTGRGLEKLSSKISKLEIEPSSTRTVRKNITM